MLWNLMEIKGRFNEYKGRFNEYKERFYGIKKDLIKKRKILWK